MDFKKVYDTVMEVEKRDNLMHINQDNKEREICGDKDYLAVVGDACEKFNKEFNGTFDDISLEKIKSLYDVEDESVVLRLKNIQDILGQKIKRYVSLDELIEFLVNIMNFDEMQIWLMRKQREGMKISLDEKLKKFFEISSDEDIIGLYDIEQNFDQNNIDGIRKLMKRNI